MSNKKKPVIVITGGSRGLGQALVMRALAEQYQVATFSRKKNHFIESIENDPNRQNDFYWQSLDITNDTEQKLFVSTVLEKFEVIDALVNNAAIGYGQILTLTQPEMIRDIVNINLIAPIQLTRYCVKSMLVNKKGNIINISSIMGLRGYSGYSCYGATKTALNGFTTSLAKEFGPSNIRVNAIAPGYFESNLVQNIPDEEILKIKKRTPLKRLATTEDIVNGVFFFLSPSSSFITGQILTIDGGFTC